MEQNEQNTGTENPYQFARTRAWPKLLAIGVIFLAIAIAIWNLPQGYSTDLTLIGKGKPALVQVFDPNQVHSLELMETVNGLRGEYAGKVEFLIADLNREPGRAFAEQQGAKPPALILFASNGVKVTTLSGVQTPEDLKKLLGKLLGK
jgi:thioredoxin-like negative regulator of GroEL